MVRNRAFAAIAGAGAALLALTLSACAPALAPRGLTNDPPHIARHFFVTRDGLKLPLREWDAKHPRAIIVALHGMSDYSESFDMPGPYWAEHGITTFAYDQRGFGAAPDPGIWAGGTAMRHDLSDFVDAIHARYPNLPVYALGESMGGAVVLSSLADKSPPRIAGAILCAPAVWARKDMPLTYRVALWLTAHTVPWLHLSGEGLHIWPSDNIPMLRKLARDPLYQHTARADQVYGLVNLMDAARFAPEHLKRPPPILYLYGAHDQIIPKAPNKATIKALGHDAKVIRFPHGFHMLLRDLNARAVWGSIVTWIEDTDEPRMAERGQFSAFDARSPVLIPGSEVVATSSLTSAAARGDIMSKEQEKKHDLRDALTGREDLASEARAHAGWRDNAGGHSDVDIVKPAPDNATVPAGQTNKGGA